MGKCLNTGKTWFKKGTIPWNKGTKGIHLSPASEFKNGQLKGEKNVNFNGGFAYYKRDNIWIICCRDGKTVPYSQIVMQNIISRKIRKTEIVHHKNGDTTDNRPENLILFTRSQHLNFHRNHIKEGKSYGSII